MAEKQHRPFAPPKDEYVKLHNSIFDIVMPCLPPNAWKVLCVIARETFGWNTDKTEPLGQRKILKMAGISSLETLGSALEVLIKTGCITRNRGDGFHADSYLINAKLILTTKEKFQSLVNKALEVGSVTETVTLKKPRSATKTVTLPVTEIVTPSVTEIVTSIERQGKKDTEKDKVLAVAALGDENPPKALSSHQQMMKTLHDTTGPISDGGKQGKAVKWLLDNKYSVEESTECLMDCLSDPNIRRRGKIGWHTVMEVIGTWKAKKQIPERKMESQYESKGARNVRNIKEFLAQFETADDSLNNSAIEIGARLLNA